MNFLNHAGNFFSLLSDIFLVVFSLFILHLNIFKALQDQHEQFRESLQQAEDDMRTLRRLDKQIKSYHVSINPYVFLIVEIFHFVC